MPADILSPRWQLFRAWLHGTRRTVGEVYTKMHAIWNEKDTKQLAEFQKHATADESYVYAH